MKHRKTFRIDKLFGLATLVCLLVITLMVYNDFFKDTVSEGNVIGKETESETRTSGYLNPIFLMIIRMLNLKGRLQRL